MIVMMMVMVMQDPDLKIGYEIALSKNNSRNNSTVTVAIQEKRREKRVRFCKFVASNDSSQ